jgi:hypothetical protein
MPSSFSLFRTMRADAQGAPLVGRESSMLGVRIAGPQVDIRILDDGTVQPATGGMSVFVDPRKMPKPLRPRTLPDKPGESPFPCFKLEDAHLAPTTLAFRKGKDHHGVIEPRAQCAFEHYEAQLTATHPQWKVAYAAPK